MHPLLTTLSKRPITASGSLGNLAGSAATVTGTQRTLTVPSANSGNIRFESVSSDGTTQYSKNGGAFTTLASNDVVNFANSDTLQMRTTGLSVGQGGGATLKDVTTGRTIEAVSLNRTS